MKYNSTTKKSGLNGVTVYIINNQLNIYCPINSDKY
jgi:hypothetical protein